MSDPREQPMQDAAGGEAIRAQAADWILRQRLEETWSEQDQGELDTWLAQSTAHLLAYLRLRAAWKQTDRLAALRGSSQSSPQYLSSRWRSLIRGAAILGFAAVLGAIGLTYLERPAERIVSTGIGQHQRITLAE